MPCASSCGAAAGGGVVATAPPPPAAAAALARELAAAARREEDEAPVGALKAPPPQRFPYQPWLLTGDADGDRGLRPPAEVKRLLAPFVSDERKERIARVSANRTYDVLPVVEGVYDLGNLLAVCRSAEAFGMGGVEVVATQGAKWKQSARTSAGAVKWLEVNQRNTVAETVEAVKARGYRLLVTHDWESSEPLESYDWTIPTAVVLGNEKYGVSDEMVAAADGRVSIPMVGFVESFNVSVAASLVLYHAYMDRCKRLGGASGNLTEEQREILEAELYLRSAPCKKWGSASRFVRALMEREEVASSMEPKSFEGAKYRRAVLDY